MKMAPNNPKNMKALVKLIRLGKNNSVNQIYSTFTMISPGNGHCAQNKVERGITPIIIVPGFSRLLDETVTVSIRPSLL